MTNNGIDATRDKDFFVPPGGGEWTLLLLLVTRQAKDIHTRAQEESTIDTEDFWTQAEEANAVDPIG